MRYAKRKDGNQDKEVAELVARGYSVWDTHHIGHGFPDLLIRKNGKSAVYGIELKNTGKRKNLTDAERSMHEWLKDFKSVIVAETSEEIIEKLK